MRLHVPGLAALAAGLVFAAPAAVHAHPHVWVAVEATVAYDGGNIKGLSQRWEFDDMYTAMAIQGLDTNGDGTYTREELQDLAKVNIDGIEQFEYFTFAKLAGTQLKFVRPTEFWLEYQNEKLTLTFLLPLEAPVAAKAPGFEFSIYDPTWFIAFDLPKDTSVKLGAGAPAGCELNLNAPASQGGEAQALVDAFTAQLGGDASSLAKTVRVECARS